MRAAARLSALEAHLAAPCAAASAPPRRTPAAAPTAAEKSPYVARSDGGRVYYEAYGDRSRPCLVLVHGAGGNHAVWWRNLPHLAARFFVVAVDLRGFGLSTPYTDPQAFEPAKGNAEDVAAVLDHEGVASAVWVCQSFGGYAGIWAAAKLPGRVRGLVMCNTCCGLSAGDAALSGAGLQRRLAAHSRAIEEAGVPFKASLGGAALGAPFQKANPELALQYGQNGSFNAGFKASGGPGGKLRVSDAEARAVACPALVISSEFDPFFPRNVLTEAAALIGPRGAELAYFPGHGHSLYFEDPVGFHATLDGFLRRNRLD